MVPPVLDYNTVRWCRVADLVYVRDLYTKINAIQFFAYFLPWWHTKIVWEKFLTPNTLIEPLSKDNKFQLFCNHKSTFISTIYWNRSRNTKLNTIRKILCFTINIFRHCIIFVETIYHDIVLFGLRKYDFGSSCNKWYVFYVLVLDGKQCSNKSYERYNNRNVRIAHNIEYLSTCIKSSYNAISVIMVVLE